MAARATIRVRGVTYRSTDAAYVAAAELEDRAEQIATNLRRDGKDAEAEQVVDRAAADADRLRTWAREREEADAHGTDQPADAPVSEAVTRDRSRQAKSGRSAAGKRPASDRRRRGRNTASRAGSRRLTPATRTIITGTGIPRATDTATGLALKVAGMTIGAAFLTLLLTDRGVSAFAGLAGAGAGGLRWILDPVDPLAPRNDFTAPPRAGVPNGGDFSARATAAATRPTRPVPRTLNVPVGTGIR